MYDYEIQRAGEFLGFSNLCFSQESRLKPNIKRRGFVHNICIKTVIGFGLLVPSMSTETIAGKPALTGYKQIADPVFF